MDGLHCLSTSGRDVDGQPVESEIVGKDNPINVSMVNKVSVGGEDTRRAGLPTVSSCERTLVSSHL